MFGASSDRLIIGFALVIATVFVAAIFVVINLWCKSQSGHQARAHDSPGYRASDGLDPCVVESFPVYKYSEVAARSGPLECAVCLSPYEPDEKIRVLPKCNHVFHMECLHPWLKDHSTCPLCRIDLVPETGEFSQMESGQVNGLEDEVNKGGNEDNDAPLEARVDIEEGQGQGQGHFRKYRRCKSTGHVAKIGRVEIECWNRFTLVLPEDEEAMKFGGVTNKFRRIRSSI